jgi:hypothetical protein
MKKFIHLLLFVAPVAALCQVDIRVGIAQNTFNFMYGTQQFYYGGAGASAVSPIADFDIHLGSFKSASRKGKPMALGYKSLLVCVNYHSANLQQKGYTESNDPMYSRFEAQVIYVPLLYKLNAQLFVLDEDFHIAFGLGMVNGVLLQAALHEEGTDYQYDSDNQLTGQVDYADNRDVTAFSRRYWPGLTLEMSFAFKRAFLSIRPYIFFGNQYMEGLEAQWSVPVEYSVYFNAHQQWSKITYGGGAFVLAFKIN